MGEGWADKDREKLQKIIGYLFLSLFLSLQHGVGLLCVQSTGAAAAAIIKPCNASE